MDVTLNFKYPEDIEKYEAAMGEIKLIEKTKRFETYLRATAQQSMSEERKEIAQGILNAFEDIFHPEHT